MQQNEPSTSAAPTRGSGSNGSRTIEKSRMMNYLVCRDFDIDRPITEPLSKFSASKLEIVEGYGPKFPYKLPMELSLVTCYLISPVRCFLRKKIDMLR